MVAASRWKNVLALYIPGAIYVNENALDVTLYGHKRFILFHESIHRKYNDMAHSFVILFLGKRRADIEGAYGTTCALCVREASYFASTEDQSYGGKGYLCRGDFEIIAEDLARDNQLCSYHEKNRVLARFYDHMKVFGNDLAASEYQELGKEAQCVLGIPEKYHVPIKKFPSSLTSFPIAALATPEAIFVNEVRLNQEAYGAKRCVMFHEAIHKKYNDVGFNLFIKLVTLFGSGFLARKLLLYFKPAISRWISYPAMSAIALITMCITARCYSYFIERRAEIQGHYATGCSQCVQESAARRCRLAEIDKNFLKNNGGYLLADTLAEIAEDLKAQGKLCSYHTTLNANIEAQPTI
ncbi:unnamed protein product [Didymodactylos carnosus]|uniref:Uncharacterized protein n=1 Tax=Didymodactylos carnosus TaxID=1234261 RepID=A0A815PF39_9BILA|nr:unnamed protein product [Didymodactylos carnosus]CAF4322357.1 unnamed protein product [Didymodactylos carnosus]